MMQDEPKACLCLRCVDRFGCDYALSMWAARARFRLRIPEDVYANVESITIVCTRFREERDES